MMTDRDEQFERERAQAIEDLQRDTVESFYVGTVLDEDDTRAIEYRLRTDDDDPRERNQANLLQAAMVLSVIADEADASLEEVAQASVERAKAQNLRQQM
jgi:hypothetical protein